MCESNLREEREELTWSLGDGSAFPGSAQWRRDNAAEAALKAFDSEHPEVFAAIRAEKKANDAAVSSRLGWV